MKESSGITARSIVLESYGFSDRGGDRRRQSDHRAAGGNCAAAAAFVHVFDKKKEDRLCSDAVSGLYGRIPM